MTAGTLMLSVIFGSIGTGMFVFGKRQESIAHIAAGIALIAFPYLITNWLIMCLVGTALTVAPFLMAA